MAPICWVIPPASPSCTLVCRILSRSFVLPAQSKRCNQRTHSTSTYRYLRKNRKKAGPQFDAVHHVGQARYITRVRCMQRMSSSRTHEKVKSRAYACVPAGHRMYRVITTNRSLSASARCAKYNQNIFVSARTVARHVHPRQTAPLLDEMSRNLLQQRHTLTNTTLSPLLSP